MKITLVSEKTVTNEREAFDMEATPMGLLEAILRLRIMRGQMGTEKFLFVNERLLHPELLAWLRLSRFNKEIRRWRTAEGRERDRPLSRVERAEEVLRIYLVGDMERIRDYVKALGAEEERFKQTLIAAVPLSPDESREARRGANARRQREWRARRRKEAEIFAAGIEPPEPRNVVDERGDTALTRELRHKFAPSTVAPGEFPPVPRLHLRAPIVVDDPTPESYQERFARLNYEDPVTAKLRETLNLPAPAPVIPSEPEF